MRALLLALALSIGCTVADAAPAEYPGVDVCYQADSYTSYCETDFYFVPGYWVPAGPYGRGRSWVRGHYFPRPGHRGYHGGYHRDGHRGHRGHR